jgi:predicted amidophosphoribosyltransferase
MRAILDLLLPTLCPACRHAEGPGICAPCAAAIPRLDNPCRWCGTPQGPRGNPLGPPSSSSARGNPPFPGAPSTSSARGNPPSGGNPLPIFSAKPKPCFRCRDAGFPHLQSIQVTSAYTGVISHLVTAAKAGARPAAVRALADLITDPPADWPTDAVVTPIPPSPGRRPGPHLATALATAIARRTHRPLRHLLRLTRHAAPQHRLDGPARQANVAGLFAAKPANTPVILVDDLLTSGATITAAAAALHAAGSGKIFALILARTPNHGDPPTIQAPWAGPAE